MRVVGIDLGSKSIDLCGLEDESLILDETLETVKIAENPDLIVDILESVKPLDLIVGPSGFGLPLTHISRVGEQELTLISLTRPEDADIKPKLGLRNLLRSLKRSGLNVYLTPSVKHLPSVPAHRKINKVDMGTADKVCVAALAIKTQSELSLNSFSQPSFILGELGFAYNAFIAVDKGEIVDGVGGTLGGMGFLTPGCLDGELAYLFGGFDRNVLSVGGASSVAGMPIPDFGLFTEKSRCESQYKLAWDALMESIEKSALSLSNSIKGSNLLLLSGRLARRQEIYREIEHRLTGRFAVSILAGFAKHAKESAQGAALIANGLCGGRFQGLVKCMRLNEAQGTVLDHIYLEKIEALKGKFNIKPYYHANR